MICRLGRSLGRPAREGGKPPASCANDNVPAQRARPGLDHAELEPTHQFHLGVWFNNPNLPFGLGCEPGQAAPVVTPFNGEQHAGIQVVNTANFPANAGPLSQIPR